MHVQTQSSSGINNTTAPGQPGTAFNLPRPLLAVAVIGAAVIGYLVHKTPDARERLESLTSLAQTMGDLSDSDALVIAELLAKPCRQNPPTVSRNV